VLSSKLALEFLTIVKILIVPRRYNILFAEGVVIVGLQDFNLTGRWVTVDRSPDIAQMVRQVVAVGIRIVRRIAVGYTFTRMDKFDITITSVFDTAYIVPVSPLV